MTVTVTVTGAPAAAGRRAPAGMLLALVLLTGCGPAGEGGEQVEPSGPEESATPSSPEVSGPAAEAVADLARRLGLPRDEIEVVSVEEVTWSDGSVGCAEEGKAYTQALVPGHRIVLRAEARTHEYHAGGSRGVFPCERPTQ